MTKYEHYEGAIIYGIEKHLIVSNEDPEDFARILAASQAIDATERIIKNANASGEEVDSAIVYIDQIAQRLPLGVPQALFISLYDSGSDGLRTEMSERLGIRTFDDILRSIERAYHVEPEKLESAQREGLILEEDYKERLKRFELSKKALDEALSRRENDNLDTYINN